MKIPAWTSFLARVCPLAALTLWVGSSAHAADSASVKKLFADPPREFSSGPLWVWNDLLTEQQIVDTMRDLAGQQVKQVFVHPRPGLMTPYLSADWFRLWKTALREAERLDMNVWIYDENSYPSGFAGGLVPEAMPEARGRGLVLRESQKAPKWDNSMLAVFRMSGDKPENVTEQVRSGAALPDGHPYRIAAVQRAANSPWNGGRCYVDLLYPGVTEKFLDITLGAYQREIGEQFGKRVPGSFTDEPNIIPAGGLPWTEDLPEQFRKRWGYDLVDSIPSLYFEVGDWRRVRHNYYAVLSQLFMERWAKPYADRCEKLGLEMTGHYWEHEWPNCRGVPDNMAMYAWEQRPAIDCLMNQYAEHTHAQFGNARSVRELGSIANQLGKKRTLCEVYGAGGWDLRFQDMKRQADWLGVLGVNTFNQHLSYVTLRGARKRDHPQSFSYHEPWWGDYKLCGAYLERLTVAVSQGQQVNHILLLEPTTTAWMYQGSDARLKAVGDSFFNLIMALEAAQVEYDLGCEDVMARHGSVQGHELKVGQRTYDTVVLPPLTENLDSRTWDLLNDYVAAGGKVLACQPLASSYVPRRDGVLAPNDAALAAWNPRWRRVEAAALPELLRTESQPGGLLITRKAGDKGILFHMRRQLADGEVLLLVNTSLASPSAGSLESEAKGIEQWDLETGKVKRFGFEPSAKGVRSDFELPPSGSLLLFLSQTPRQPAVKEIEQSYVLPPLDSVEVQRVEPNVLVLDYVDITAGAETRTNIYFYQANEFAFQKNGMDRNPWDSAVQFKDELITRTFPVGSGFQATYHFRIEQKVPTLLSLVVERPDLYAITCNGKPVSASPGAWWLDKSFGKIDIAGPAQLGDNEITLKASPFTIYHELEPAYVLGNFALRAGSSGFVMTRDHALRVGKWNEQGHPFYAAGVSYQQRYNVGEQPSAQYQYVVTLPNWYGSVAEVRVNGNPAGYIAYPPWQCDVTSQMSNGENTVEIVVIGTLKNTLGPHHGKPTLGTAWPGMFQRGPIPGPPGTDYDTVGYGMFEAFQLKQVSSQ
jgi:alpha-L-rhamnosidase